MIENEDLLKQTMMWNSSENLLTLVEAEEENDETTKTLFFVNLVSYITGIIMYKPKHFIHSVCELSKIQESVW